MKYQIIKTTEGYKAKYQSGDSFEYFDDATSDYLGGKIKIWRTLRGVEKFIIKNCFSGKPIIEYINN